MGLVDKRHRYFKTKDAIDDHICWVVIKWCLIWATRDRGFWTNVKRWADELAAHMEPGLYRLITLDGGHKARAKLVDEVLCSDAKLDQPAIVADVIRYRFQKEGFRSTPPSVAARAWVEQGFPKVRAVYRGELSLMDFERELCGQSPV